MTFVGTSRKDLQAFPDRARRKAGFALQRAQEGVLPTDAKPMKGFGGASVVEIVIRDDGDAFRVIYTMAIAEMIYVLHAFQKKSTHGIATSDRDLDLIRQRLREALADADAHGWR